LLQYLSGISQGVAVIEGILVNVMGGILSDILSPVLKQPMKHILDEHAIHLALASAIKKAEARFERDYGKVDAEIAHALLKQTRFADLPSVRAALTDMFTHPFHNQSHAVAILHGSFDDVLPAQVDRARINAAVNAFLHSLGEEVLYIPQLQQLYTLAFQKMSAENSSSIAANTAAMVEHLQDLHNDIRQLPNLLSAPVTFVINESTEPTLLRHNLPQRPYTQFVGREIELQKLTQLLLPYPQSRHFLVTLDGIGGVGKSALALEIAYQYRDTSALLPSDERFEAIVWVSAKRTLLTASGIQHRQQTFSTLADLNRAIATVFELPMIMQAENDQRRGLVEQALTRKRTLLIVDNLETVDDEEVLTFLHELPDPTKAIVTTRHRIDIAYALRLTGMPHADAQALIALESERKGVSISADAAEDLYRRTGGIPLAIVWSIALMSLGYGVESVLRRLGSGHSDVARFCFAESVASIREQDAYRMLSALALFDASVNRQMLGEVTGLGQDEVGRDDALAKLLQLSLVNQQQDRFSLLPLTRSFVAEKLAQQPALEQMLREQWIAYFISLARPYADLHLRWHDLPMIRHEGVHYVTLTSWCQQAGRPDMLLKILPALAFYYDNTGQWADLISIAKIALEYAQLIGDHESIVFIETHVLCQISSHQGNHEEAESYIRDALKTVKLTDNLSRECEVLLNYARVWRRRNQFKLALHYCQQAFQLVTHLTGTQQIYMQAYVDYELGKYHRDRHDWQAAQRQLYAARNVFRADEIDPVFNTELAWGILSNLGFVEHQLGNLESAAQMYLQCLAFFQELGGRGTMTTLLVRLALLEEQRNNLATAFAYANEAFYWSQRLNMVEEQSLMQSLLIRLSEQTG
jgi:tetratricopeptide (TPR) repeat protein